MASRRGSTRNRRRDTNGMLNAELNEQTDGDEGSYLVKISSRVTRHSEYTFAEVIEEDVKPKKQCLTQKQKTQQKQKKSPRTSMLFNKLKELDQMNFANPDNSHQETSSKCSGAVKETNIDLSSGAQQLNETDMIDDGDIKKCQEQKTEEKQQADEVQLIENENKNEAVNGATNELMSTIDSATNSLTPLVLLPLEPISITPLIESQLEETALNTPRDQPPSDDVGTPQSSTNPHRNPTSHIPKFRPSDSTLRKAREEQLQHQKPSSSSKTIKNNQKKEKNETKLSHSVEIKKKKTSHYDASSLKIDLNKDIRQLKKLSQCDDVSKSDVNKMKLTNQLTKDIQNQFQKKKKKLTSNGKPASASKCIEKTTLNSQQEEKRIEDVELKEKTSETSSPAPSEIQTLTSTNENKSLFPTETNSEDLKSLLATHQAPVRRATNPFKQVIAKEFFQTSSADVPTISATSFATDNVCSSTSQRNSSGKIESSPISLKTRSPFSKVLEGQCQQETQMNDSKETEGTSEGGGFKAETITPVRSDVTSPKRSHDKISQETVEEVMAEKMKGNEAKVEDNENKKPKNVVAPVLLEPQLRSNGDQPPVKRNPFARLVNKLS